MSARPRHSAVRGLFALLCGVVLTLPSPALAGSEAKTRPARLDVKGYGIVGNRELERILKTLELGGAKPDFFTVGFIEDASIILTSRVKQDGFLEPRITVELDTDGGQQLLRTGESLRHEPLPPSLRVKRALFRINKGVFYHLVALNFEGLKAVPEKQARSFFVETGTLVNLKSHRVYTPEGARRGLNNLRDRLERLGFRQALVEIEDLHRDDVTGAVRMVVRIREGPHFTVHSVRERFFFEDAEQPEESPSKELNVPYSRPWLQDYQQSLKTNLYRLGYPDATVEVRPGPGDTNLTEIRLELIADVKSGPRVRVGEVRIEGERKTKEPFLKRRVRVERGDWLNPVRAERGRYRLAQLGVFRGVSLDYEAVDERTRNLIYRVEEGKRFDLSLLFGYGSYELLRGGVEAGLFNIWGLAHHANLTAIQSFKASSGEFTYTVPQFAASDIDVFLGADGLRREEVSFVREEYGGGIGAHRFVRQIATDLTLRYNYEILKAAEPDSDFAVEGLTNAAVSAFIAEIRHDRRDNLLYPRRGYRLVGTFEFASEALGGEVDYQRIEASGSWHLPLGGGRYFSLGLSHGLVVTSGEAREDLPFNRRLFPGGENSIRGYQEGEASPRNEEGKFVGTETFTLGVAEFEQAITRRWSVVLFADALGFARRLEDYPFDTGLYSVGAGLRWRTLIGPVRVEYGHNLNPRSEDPSGTFHFSLGYPF